MRFWWSLPIFCVLLVVSINNSNAQQYIPFAQHAFNGAQINPAYVGYKEMWFAQVGVRSQWSKIEGAPKSGYANIDGVLDPVAMRHGAWFAISL